MVAAENRRFAVNVLEAVRSIHASNGCCKKTDIQRYFHNKKGMGDKISNALEMLMKHVPPLVTIETPKAFDAKGRKRGDKFYVPVQS